MNTIDEILKQNCISKIKKTLSNINTNLINILKNNNVIISGTFVAYHFAENPTIMYGDIDIYTSKPTQLIHELDNLNKHCSVYRMNKTINYKYKYNTDYVILQIIYAINNYNNFKQFLKRFDITLTQLAYDIKYDKLIYTDDFEICYTRKSFLVYSYTSNKRKLKYGSLAKDYFNSLLVISYSIDDNNNYFRDYSNNVYCEQSTLGKLLIQDVNLVNLEVSFEFYKGCICKNCDNKCKQYLCFTCEKKIAEQLYKDYNKSTIIIGASTGFGQSISAHLNYNCKQTSYNSNGMIQYSLLDNVVPQNLLEEMSKCDIIILAATKILKNNNELNWHRTIHKCGIDYEFFDDLIKTNVNGYFKLLHAYYNYMIQLTTSEIPKQQTIAFITRHYDSFAHSEINVATVAQREVVKSFVQNFNSLNIRVIMYDPSFENVHKYNIEYGYMNMSIAITALLDIIYTNYDMYKECNVFDCISEFIKKDINTKRYYITPIPNTYSVLSNTSQEILDQYDLVNSVIF